MRERVTNKSHNESGLEEGRRGVVTDVPQLTRGKRFMKLRCQISRLAMAKKPWMTWKEAGQ